VFVPLFVADVQLETRKQSNCLGIGLTGQHFMITAVQASPT